MVKLTLSVIPPSVNQIWINKPKGRYKSKRGKEFQEMAFYELRKQYKGKLLTGRLRIEIWLYFKTKTKRDIDNYNKAILDSLKGTVIEDDELIDDLIVHKLTGKGENKIYMEILERG